MGSNPTASSIGETLKEFLTAVLGTFVLLVMFTAISAGLWALPLNGTYNIKINVGPGPLIVMTQVEAKPQEGQKPLAECLAAENAASGLDLTHPAITCLTESGL